MRKHRHIGTYESATPRGRTVRKKRPIHKFTSERYQFKKPKAANRIPKGRYVAQTKRDGERLKFMDYGRRGRLINRRNVDKTKQFPEFDYLAKKLPGKNIIDAEGVVFNDKGDDDFKLWSQRSHLKNIEEIRRKAKERPATLIALDIMNRDGKDIRSLAWNKRNDILKKLPSDKRFKIIESYPTEKAKEIMKDKTVEGIVFKKTDSVYDDKKDDNWIKLKQSNDSDVLITGYEEGEGKRKGMIGALHIGVWNGKGIKGIGKVGTGFTDKEGKELKGKLDRIMIGRINGIINVKPKLFAKVSYLKLGSSGQALREPSFISLRDDIGIKETHI